MKTCITIIIALALASCTSKNVDEATRFDTNPAEASETPGEKVRGNADTNEEAERKAKARGVEDPNPHAAQPVDTSKFVEKASKGSKASKRGKAKG